MTELDENAARFDGAALLLPNILRDAARTLDKRGRARAEELRARIGHPVSVVLPEGERGLGGADVSRRELDGILDLATGASAYSARDSIRGGYITARGGYRIGLCGTAIPRGGEIHGFRSLSSVAIRIPREAKGAARGVAGQLISGGAVCSALILSPPGGGKTTLLRDLVRTISDGDASLGLAPARVSLADERGEIAALFDGAPQLDVGRGTDILDACPKAAAVMLLLRAMNPQFIALDEITAPEDVAAMISAANCGVRLLATAHADGAEDLLKRPLYRRLMASGIFEKTVTITRQNGARAYSVRACAALPL
ncbi:MAG: stage III sporulation protein AB [Oscillospiraceae bacterium]|jgi:stage III sporulation protein AA|nr:stage III sporulation protein AB [Oscillospiraceae bacterium]